MKLLFKFRGTQVLWFLMISSAHGTESEQSNASMRKQSDDIDLSGETMTKLVKYLNGLESRLQKSIDANKNSLALLKSSVKDSGTQTCQMGTRRCLKSGKYCVGNGETEYRDVYFSPAFASKPALIVATKSLSLDSSGWWAFWASYKSLTTKGFKVGMKLESGWYYNYEVSWIACGQI